MCGKSNPAEEDVCQQCGARLTQLGENGLDAGETGSQDDSLDWLKELSTDGSSVEPAEGSPPDSGDTGQDWLQQMRDQPTELGEPAPGMSELPGKESSEDVPERINEIGAVDSESAAAGDEGGDWLGGLRPQEESNLASQEDKDDEKVFTQGAVPDEEPLDLLSRLDMGQPPSHQEESTTDQFLTTSPDGSETPAPVGKDEDIPEWLSGLESWDPVEPQEAPDAGEKQTQIPSIPTPTQQDDVKDELEEDDGLPEWLGAETDGEPSSAGLEDEVDISDLLSALDEDAKPVAEVVEDEAGVPVWLDAGEVIGDSEETIKSEAEEITKVIPEEDEELSGWLGLKDEKQPEVVEGHKEKPTPGKEDLPDWLGGFEPPDATTDQPSISDDVLPQWLEDEREQDESHIAAVSEDEKSLDGIEAGGPVPEEPASDEGELPVTLELETEDKSADSDVSLFVSDQDDLDGWLGDPLDGVPDEKPIEPEEIDEFPAEEQPSAEMVETVAEPAPVEVPPFAGEELAGWMSKVQEESVSEEIPPGTEETISSEKPPEHPFASDEFPDWFLEDMQEEPAEKTAEEPELGAEEIERAQLPGWLAAMRPLEAVAPEKVEPLDDKKVEQLGPLAGMRAVIPSEDLVTRYRKPPIYSAKLQVTEKQRAHAAVLEKVLEDSRRSLVEGARGIKPSLNLMRIIIGLLLISVVLISLFIDPQGSPLADISTTGEIWKFVDQVENVSVEKPVLVAVDFDPGFFGEMRFLATGVLRRLMMREIHIVTVSTVPAGPVLAEGLKLEALDLSPGHIERYSQSDWFLNLGYLPGGVASLQEFAMRPQQAARVGMSTENGDQDIWESQILKQISGVDDFGLVLLVTENIDTGRAWIEQVQPALIDVPFLIVASAQAAPLFEPYVQSGQIQAMLSGFADGLSYDEITKQPGNRQGYWNAYQYALIIAVAMIFIGIIFESIRSLLLRSKPEQEA
jgi:hypothetical protein